MPDPYISEEDRIDVIGRLTARLDDAGAETLREQAVAQAEAIPDPLTPLKPVKDEGEKDQKDVKDEGEKDGEKENKDHKDGDEKDLPKDDPKEGIFEGPDDPSTTSPEAERPDPNGP